MSVHLNSKLVRLLVMCLCAETVCNVCVQVQWLLENFEKADGVSLPRCTMYSCYLRYCAHSSLDPVNTATFGKLVHSVFSNLTTRRLGTRYYTKLCLVWLSRFLLYLLAVMCIFQRVSEK